MDQRICILVVGMHRSGTSCMIGLLKILGFDQGKMASIGKSPDNPKGFFENDSVRHINDHIIRNHMSCKWNDIRPEVVRSDTPYADIIRVLIKNEFSGQRFSIKDPLVSILLDSYLEALKPIKTHVVRMHRPQNEVYDSLTRRGNEYPDHFYERYNKRLDYIIGKHKPSHIDLKFVNLVEDPIAVLELIQEKFKLDLPIEEHLDQITEFVDPKLKHNPTGIFHAPSNNGV